jgi:hypothetical protein
MILASAIAIQNVLPPHLISKLPAQPDFLSLDDLLSTCGLAAAIQALRAVHAYDNAIRLFMCRCARIAIERAKTAGYADDRPGEGIIAAERFATQQQGSLEELDTAFRAALSAAKDAKKPSFESAAVAAAWCALVYPPLAAAEAVRWAIDSISVSVESDDDEAIKIAVDKIKAEAKMLFRLEGDYGEVSASLHDAPCGRMAGLQMLRFTMMLDGIPNLPV